MTHFSRMFTIFFMAGMVSSCQPHSMPRVDLASEAERIRIRDQERVEAEGRKDLDAILAFFAEDAVIQPPGAPAAKGREAIRKLYIDLYKEAPFVSFTSSISTLSVAQGGDIAYSTGVDHYVLDRAGTRVEELGKYLAVWRKVDGEWRLAAGAFSGDGSTP